jgi:hypothetical protein
MATKKQSDRVKSGTVTEDVKVERFRMNLPVALTREEVALCADRAAQMLKNIDVREDEFKQQAQANRREIARLEADLREVSAEVRERKSYRDVVIERRFDWMAGTVTEIRTDTGEQLNHRPMNDEEAQKALPLGDDDAGDVDVDEEFDAPVPPPAGRKPKPKRGTQRRGVKSPEDVEEEAKS